MKNMNTNINVNININKNMNTNSPPKQFFLNCIWSSFMGKSSIGKLLVRAMNSDKDSCPFLDFFVLLLTAVYICLVRKERKKKKKKRRRKRRKEEKIRKCKETESVRE
jgi:hypothetical protein